MVTYITWTKADYDTVAPLYLAEVGEMLADASRNETTGMTASDRITAQNITNLEADETAGQLLTFSETKPEGWNQ
jgi:hypothetical protein